MRLISSERYQQLNASGKLPSPKGVALAIIKLLHRDDYTLNDLLQLVRSDPVIAGRLLRFANTAAFSNGIPVASISKAVAVLGAVHVRNLVIGFSILNSHRNGNCPQFDYARFWSRSLATAISAQALAFRSGTATEESFTAGLLCSVGELALASLFPDKYGEVIGVSGFTGVSGLHERLAFERITFRTEHRELTATLLTEWGLPESLVTAVYHCELPDEAGFPRGSPSHALALSLYMAHTLSEMCVTAPADRWIMVPELLSRAASLGIGTEELATLMDGIIENWRVWGQILEISTHDIPPFADILSSLPPGAMEGVSPLPLSWTMAATGSKML